MRGGVGGGVFITDAAAAAAATAAADDDDAVGCDCFVGVFFAAGLAPLADFALMGLLSTAVDLIGSLTVAVAAVIAVGVDLDLSIFRFFFFGLSSMADSDVLTSFTGFD